MKSAKVRTRIDEIMADRQRRDEKATERAIEKSAISKAWVLENLRQNAERALQQRAVLDAQGKETGEFKYDGAVANRALELIGKELGMFINRREQGRPGEFADLTDEQLDEEIKKHLLARGMTERQAQALLAAGRNRRD
jgi:hypothetical protein